MALDGDPFSAFAGNFGSSLGKGITGALTPAPAISGAQSAAYGTSIGNDGWTINFGGSQIASTTTSKAQPVDARPDYLGIRPGPADQVAPSLTTQAGMNPLLLLVVAGAVAIKVFRK